MRGGHSNAAVTACIFLLSLIVLYVFRPLKIKLRVTRKVHSPPVLKKIFKVLFDLILSAFWDFSQWFTHDVLHTVGKV